MLRILSNQLALHGVTTLRLLNVLIVLRSCKSLIYKSVCVQMLTQTTLNAPSSGLVYRVHVHMLTETTLNAPSQFPPRVFPSPQVPCEAGEANKAFLHWALCVFTFSLEPTQSLKRA